MSAGGATARGPAAPAPLTVRPRIATVILVGSAVALPAAFLVAALWLHRALPERHGPGTVALLIGTGALLGALSLGLARPRVRADATGIEVRNYARTRRLAWAEVVRVGFSFHTGEPWARLDVSDGTTLPVVAIQRADGDRAWYAAERLRAFVRYYGEAPGAEGPPGAADR